MDIDEFVTVALFPRIPSECLMTGPLKGYPFLLKMLEIMGKFISLRAEEVVFSKSIRTYSEGRQPARAGYLLPRPVWSPSVAQNLFQRQSDLLLRAQPSGCPDL